jgi:hypothetical protein
MTDVEGPTIEAGIGDDQLSGPAAGTFGLDRRLVQRAIGSLGVASREGWILPFSRITPVSFSQADFLCA